MLDERVLNAHASRNGSRGYSSIWLATGARLPGGRRLSLEHDPVKCVAWRANVAAAGLEEWAELVEGDAFSTLAATEDTFDLVFLDAEKDGYEELFALVRLLLEPGGVVVADNVLSHAETLAAYSAARQADPTLSSVTLLLDRGLELSVVFGARSYFEVIFPRFPLHPSVRSAYAGATAERRWSGLSDDSTGSGGTSG